MVDLDSLCVPDCGVQVHVAFGLTSEVTDAAARVVLWVGDRIEYRAGSGAIAADARHG